MEDDSYTRLHITPLTPALLSTYIPKSLLPSASNITYHTIETFPERPYGYITLPTMEATKLSKKLNNTILKGTKVSINIARPEPPKPSPQQPEPAKKEHKRKRARDEIPGADIGERSVKRGWTVPATVNRKSKGKKEKSKYTNAPECLFKTSLPPSTAKAGDVKEKDGKKRRAVVHEFEKSTKYATFLRTSGASTNKKPAAEFIKGKGWVDEDGNLVEAVKGGTRGVPKKAEREEEEEEDSTSEDETPTHAEKSIQVMKTAVAQDDTSRLSAPENIAKNESANDRSDNGSSEDVEKVDAGEDSQKAVAKTVQDDKEDSSSSSDTSSSEESDEETPADVFKKVIEAKATSTESAPHSTSSESSSSSDADSDSDSTTSTPTKPSSSRPQSSSGPAASLSIKIPPIPQSIASQASIPNTAVHPLEALYKRPAAQSTTTTTTIETKPPAPSFSFFGADENDDIEMDDGGGEEEPAVPLTPYTQRDFEWRGLRSAAPTPDTAHANKRFIWPVEGESSDDENVEAQTPMKSAKKDAAKDDTEEKKDGEEKSDFQKWFYEHRGETNRAWKKRRKVVGKEKRQRENRKRDNRV